jgi:hypothetical protein
VPPRAAGRQPEGHVVEGGEVREERVALRHVADGAPVGRNGEPGRAVEQCGAVERDAALVGVQEPGQQAQERGLSRAALAHQDEHGAVGGGQLRLEREAGEALSDPQLEHRSDSR